MAIPRDGGGDIETRVTRLYFIVDEHGRQIAELKALDLVRFMTKMELGVDALTGRVNRLADLVHSANLPQMSETIKEMKPKVDMLSEHDAEDRGAHDTKGDIIARVFIPVVALGSVLIAIISLLLR